MFFVIALGLLVAFGLMIAWSDWRRERIFAYLDPWSEKNALAKGYQLTHSLIAIGRGEIFGVGLGGSVEKLHWLPEAHTDFLLAVIGEEFGLVGVLCVIGLFLWLTRRIMHIGRQSIALDRVFAGLVAQGVGIWVGFQAFKYGGEPGGPAHQRPDPAADELRRFRHFGQPDRDRRGAAHRP
jgi:cell division protein FtsW